MSYKVAIKQFTKKVVPKRYHPFFRDRVLPVVRTMKGYWARSGVHTGRTDLYSQIQQVLLRSSETDRMIIGLLKASQVSSEPSNEIESKLDLILLKLDNMEAQFRETDKILLAMIKIAATDSSNAMTVGDDKTLSPSPTLFGNI